SAVRTLPARRRSRLATGPSARSRWISPHVAAKPARRCRWTTRRRFQGALASGRDGAQATLLGSLITGLLPELGRRRVAADVAQVAISPRLDGQAVPAGERRIPFAPF